MPPPGRPQPEAVLAAGKAAGSQVPLHVQGQMVGPGETPVAVGTFKRLGTRVLSEMSG